MLLKNPQMLWGLALLVIPILVHLLKLRRYRKTPFTNVRILQRLIIEANKSSRLKKWLLLLSRLGLIAALVIAFCQPFLADPRAGDPREIVVYIDNSFSMQAPNGTTSAMESAVQDLLRMLPEDAEICLITNTEQFDMQPLETLRERLLTLEFTHKRISESALSFRAASSFSEGPGFLREFWMFSDFEELDPAVLDTTGLGGIHAVRLPGEPVANMALDTAFIRSGNSDLLELEVRVRLYGTDEAEPLSLYNGDTLIAKTAPEILSDGRGQAVFSLTSESTLKGSIRILDNGLTYDNKLFFSIQRPPKIKVYGIGTGPWDYLRRIYTPDEFNFEQRSLAALDYGRLPEQHLIILNELDKIPAALTRELADFLREGGSVIVIPSTMADIPSYKTLMQTIGGPGLADAIPSENRITDIRTEHPLFRDVFEGAVRDFDYPLVNSYIKLASGGLPALSFQNGDPFLLSRGSLFLFSAALNEGNSNFRQSPLVVPTFYNIGRKSLPVAPLYYTIGKPAELDVEASLQGDDILRLENEAYSFVPRQEAFARKTRLRFVEEPPLAGHYELTSGDASLGLVSFNYPRTEGRNASEDRVFPPQITKYENPQALVERYQNDTRIKALWKWFVILALLFALAELILQKTLR